MIGQWEGAFNPGETLCRSDTPARLQLGHVRGAVPRGWMHLCDGANTCRDCPGRERVCRSDTPNAPSPHLRPCLAPCLACLAGVLGGERDPGDGGGSGASRYWGGRPDFCAPLNQDISWTAGRWDPLRGTRGGVLIRGQCFTWNSVGSRDASGVGYWISEWIQVPPWGVVSVSRILFVPWSFPGPCNPGRVP